ECVKIFEAAAAGLHVIDFCGGQVHVSQEGRGPFVSGPVVETGVGVPLEKIDGAFNGAERGDGWPGRVVIFRALPSGGGVERTFPLRAADENGWGVHT